MPRWLITVLACGSVSAGLALAAAPEAHIERADGTTVQGTLLAVDADGIRLTAVTGDMTVPVASVRRIALPTDAAAQPRQAAVTVTTTTGGRITGDDFAWQGKVAAVTRGEQRLELTLELVQLVAWRRPDDADGPPAWLAAVPEQPESDLVIVGGGADAECVACAITAVSADSVTVVLEGETIPVKRTRVAGLRWLRQPATAAGRIDVSTVAGRFDAARVTWSPAGGLVVDERIRMPADWLQAIDYAAGRTVRLATLEAERLDVEPFFAGLRGVAGLAGFFAPRVVPAGPAAQATAAPALLLRPRTVGVWRVPADSRRFFGTFRPAGDAAPRARVVIDLDGREAFRGGLTGDDGRRDLPIDLDVTGVRRLTLTVDFADGGPGGPLRFDEARFEK